MLNTKFKKLDQDVMHSLNKYDNASLEKTLSTIKYKKIPEFIKEKWILAADQADKKHAANFEYYMDIARNIGIGTCIISGIAIQYMCYDTSYCYTGFLCEFPSACVPFIGLIFAAYANYASQHPLDFKQIHLKNTLASWENGTLT